MKDDVERPTGSSTSSGLPLTRDHRRARRSARRRAWPHERLAADPAVRERFPVVCAGAAGRRLAATAQHGDDGRQPPAAHALRVLPRHRRHACNKRAAGFRLRRDRRREPHARDPRRAASTASRRIPRTWPCRWWRSTRPCDVRGPDGDARTVPIADFHVDRATRRNIETVLGAGRADHRDRGAAAPAAHAFGLPQGARPRVVSNSRWSRPRCARDQRRHDPRRAVAARRRRHRGRGACRRSRRRCAEHRPSGETFRGRPRRGRDAGTRARQRVQDRLAKRTLRARPCCTVASGRRHDHHQPWPGIVGPGIDRVDGRAEGHRRRALRRRVPAAGSGARGAGAKHHRRGRHRRLRTAAARRPHRACWRSSRRTTPRSCRGPDSRVAASRSALLQDDADPATTASTSRWSSPRRSIAAAAAASRGAGTDYRRPSSHLDGRCAGQPTGRSTSATASVRGLQPRRLAAALGGARRQGGCDLHHAGRAHNPMEPHATIAAWDGDKLTVYDVDPGISRARATLARTFGSTRSRSSGVAPFVGGGFGCQGHAWPHAILAAMAAGRSAGR